MTAELWGQQFRDQMRRTWYPFDAQATLVTTSGLSLPQNAIADAVIAPVGSWSQLALTQIVVTLTEVTLWIGDELNSQASSAVFDPQNVPQAVPLADVYGRPAGMFRFNQTRIAELLAWPTGTYTFPAGTANFLVSVLVPIPVGGVQGILVGKQMLTDTVYLIGDAGIVLTVDTQANTITFSAVGDPLFKRRDCLAGGGFTTPSFLLSINSIAPNTHGGYLLVPASFTKGDTALRIDPQGTNTLVISIAGGRP